LQGRPSAHSASVPPGQLRQSGSRPSQSWSIPSSQISIGGVQAPSAHAPSQRRVPAVPHDVVHGTDAPCTQAKPSSAAPLQSSSMPLHVSAGAAHTLQLQVALQMREPVEPHAVVHEPISPAAHVEASSVSMSQSSSTPLHTSGAPGNTAVSESSQSSAGTLPSAGHVASP
jgi:hypothetical protein